MPGEHVVTVEAYTDGRTTGEVVALCTCGSGFTQATPEQADRWGRSHVAAAEERSRRDAELAALKPERNACRYCAAPIGEWGPLFCGDRCAKADGRRKTDRAAALQDAAR